MSLTSSVRLRLSSHRLENILAISLEDRRELLTSCLFLTHDFGGSFFAFLLLGARTCSLVLLVWY